MEQINWPKVLKSWVLIALGVLLAAWTSRGSISYDSTGSLALAVVLISLFNVLLRPLMVLLALPFVVLTLGLGIFVINALLFMLAGAITPGFEVASFWAALWGALVTGAVSLLANMLLGGTRVRVQVSGGGPGQGPGKRSLGKKDDDVIDI